MTVRVEIVSLLAIARSAVRHLRSWCFTYFFTTGDTPLLSAKCSPVMKGAGLTINYQVLDQNGNAFQMAGMTPLETVTVNRNLSAQNEPFSTPQQTPSSGAFQDTPVGSCFGPPIVQRLCECDSKL